MSISTPFIRRPIATSLLTAAILLAGLVAFPLLPVAPLPNVEFPTLAVSASYPGASPETMASTVATPLETEFGEMLPGLAQMTSTSVQGSTQISLQFDLSTDIKTEETMVLEAINAAEGSLPKNMPTPPTFRETNPSDAPIMILSMQSDQAPITDVDNYAENLVEQQLSQLSGVGQVLVGGQQTPAIRVQVDPARLASMGLTMEDVRTVLTNATVDNPKGSIDGPKQSYTIYANDQLTKAEPVQQHHCRISQRRSRSVSAILGMRWMARRIANSPHGPTVNAQSCCWCSSRQTPMSFRRPTALRPGCGRWQTISPPTSICRWCRTGR